MSISSQYVCDGISHCKSKEDETDCNCFKGHTSFRNCAQQCQELLCSLHFSGAVRCVQTSICISVSNVCDGILDCPQEDDEYGCNLRTCIFGCSCLNYAIHCTNIEQINFLDMLPYYKVMLEHVLHIAWDSSKVLRHAKMIIISSSNLGNGATSECGVYVFRV